MPELESTGGGILESTKVDPKKNDNARKGSIKNATSFLTTTGPGETIGPGLDQKFRKALQKVLSVAVIAKDVAPINTSDNNVLQKVRNIKAGGSWHAGRIDYVRELVNK